MHACTDLQNADFARLGEVIGLKGWRVERNEALEGAAVAPRNDPCLL